MLGDTLKVKIAATDCAGLSLVVSWFQVNVIGPFAFWGVQLLVVMFNVSESPLPVFLTYTVRVVVPPAVKVPQSKEVSGVVHALLEYTPRFAEVVTVPLEDTFWVVVMAA